MSKGKPGFWKNCFTAAPLVLAVLLIFAATLLIKPLRAWAATLDQKWQGVMQADAADTATVTEFYMLLGGVDSGGLVQALQVDATGNLQVDVLSGGGSTFIDNATFTPSTDLITMIGGYFDDTVTGDPTENDGAAGRIDSKRAFITRLEGETRGVSADVLTAGADNVVNTTNGAWTYSGMMGYESVGGVWDRVAIDTAANLMMSFGTALDSTNDSITAVGQFTDGSTGFTQETSKTVALGFLFDDTVGTALAENDIAAPRINLNRSVVGVLESAATRGLFTEVLTAGADDTANTTNGLFTYSTLMAWDGTDIDRLMSFTEGDDLNPATTDSGLLGVTAFGVAYDVVGATWDRTTKAQIDGYYTPDAANTLVIAANGGEDCTSDNVVTAGTWAIQSDGRIPCILGADAATIAADANDMPIESPGVYYWRATGTTTDTICCVSPAGTINVHITPVTLN